MKAKFIMIKNDLMVDRLFVVPLSHSLTYATLRMLYHRDYFVCHSSLAKRQTSSLILGSILSLLNYLH